MVAQGKSSSCDIMQFNGSEITSIFRKYMTTHLYKYLKLALGPLNPKGTSSPLKILKLPH